MGSFVLFVLSVSTFVRQHCRLSICLFCQKQKLKELWLWEELARQDKTHQYLWHDKWSVIFILVLIYETVYKTVSWCFGTPFISHWLKVNPLHMTWKPVDKADLFHLPFLLALLLIDYFYRSPNILPVYSPTKYQVLSHQVPGKRRHARQSCLFATLINS